MVKNLVILVHGITDSAEDMKQIAAFLKSSGYRTAAITMQPNDASVPLQTYTAQLDNFINEHAGESGIVDLVAFSMGGLVSLQWLLYCGGLARTQHFVSISAPVSGTSLASVLNLPGIKRLADYPGILDMRRDSPFIQGLQSKLSELSRIAVTTVRTPFDLIVVPSETAEIPAAKEDNYVVKALAHRWMMFDQRVNTVILAGLLKEVPQDS